MTLNLTLTKAHSQRLTNYKSKTLLILLLVRVMGDLPRNIGKPVNKMYRLVQISRKIVGKGPAGVGASLGHDTLLIYLKCRLVYLFFIYLNSNY